MAGFPAISDPLLKLPAADADGDGRSNFLEYITGADPGSGSDPQACQIYAEGAELSLGSVRASKHLGAAGLVQ